jgi:hypothetical protein
MVPKSDRCELVAADGTFDLVVPKVDGEPRRHVFASAEDG